MPRQEFATSAGPAFEGAEDRALAAFALRSAPGLALAGEAPRIVRACRAIAARFRGGGTLFTFGEGVAAADAAHLATEFAHPVIVGKPALAAVSLSCDAGAWSGTAAGHGVAEAFSVRLEALAGPSDIALGLCSDGGVSVWRGLEAARSRGALTVALTGEGSSPDADHVLAVPSRDPRVVRELHVTVYHVLWELVHVFLDHHGPLQESSA